MRMVKKYSVELTIEELASHVNDNIHQKRKYGDNKQGMLWMM